jgi:hypothetical protein
MTTRQVIAKTISHIAHAETKKDRPMKIGRSLTRIARPDPAGLDLGRGQPHVQTDGIPAVMLSRCVLFKTTVGSQQGAMFASQSRSALAWE